MKTKLNLLTTYVFLIGTLVLLLNDFVLKYQYHNWFTGKLSDFVGLFVFTIFCIAIIPKHKFKIAIGVALFFIYWKSSYSQLFITHWNDLGLFSISRVIDYSDLIALISIPIAYVFSKTKEPITFIKINPVLPLALASFAFMATSYQKDFEVNKTYEFNISKEVLKSKLKNVDGLNLNQDIVWQNTNPETITFSLPIEQHLEAFIYTVNVKESKDKSSIEMKLTNVLNTNSTGEKNENLALKTLDSLITKEILTETYISQNYLLNRDLDGDGLDDKIDFSIPSGAHCCYKVSLTLSSTKEQINYPFEMEGGYLLGVDNSKPNQFKIEDIDNDGIVEIIMEIKPYIEKEFKIKNYDPTFNNFKIVFDYKGGKIELKQG